MVLLISSNSEFMETQPQNYPLNCDQNETFIPVILILTNNSFSPPHYFNNQSEYDFGSVNVSSINYSLYPARIK